MLGIWWMRCRLRKRCTFSDKDCTAVQLQDILTCGMILLLADELPFGKGLLQYKKEDIL